MSEFQGIQDALASSRGGHIEESIHLLKISLRVLLGNDAELMSSVTEYRDPVVASGLWPRSLLGDFSRLDEFLIDVARKLHNYVASARMLVDHTRRWVDKNFSDDADFAHAYDAKKVVMFGADPPVRFLHDLRNYALHRTLPVPKGKSPPGSSLTLETLALLEWDGWWREAREFMQAHLNGIELGSVVSHYTEKVRSFHEWLEERVRRDSEADLREYEELKVRLRQYYEKRRS